VSDAGTPSAVLRRDRARRAVGRLREDVDGWLAGWQGRREQTSQLALVRASLTKLIDRLDARARTIAAEAFADARKLDADVAVVERLWRYLAERLDQRRDPARQATLAAADEVIWACVAEARELGDPAMPLPLAYLEPAFSPIAIPRTEPPLELAASERALARMLARLPLPLIGLPTAVVDEPWWLVLVAHEVGHQVQYDLVSEGALIERTDELLATAGGPDGESWREWSREVFADAFAIATAGEAALTSMAELEWGDAAWMAAPRPPYPPVLVRLALASALARALGLGDAAPTIASLRALATSLADRDLAHATFATLDRVEAAATALAALPVPRDAMTNATTTSDGATGRGLFGALVARFHRGNDGPLADVLAGDDQRLTPARFRPVRAAAAAFRTYRALADVDDGAREAALDRLRLRTLALIRDVRDPADPLRATITAALDDGAARVAADLADLLPSEAGAR
jgi:hypothetical protein